MNKEKKEKEFEEAVIAVDRCSKAIKGGRKMSFRAFVVIGNKKGKVGLGLGKANEVSNAINKATKAAHKNLFRVNLFKTTIPHIVYDKKCGAKIMLRPASPGTGIIAGGAMRTVLEFVGIKDVLAKSLGSNNTINVAKATEKALKILNNKKFVDAKRGKVVKEKAKQEVS